MGDKFRRNKNLRRPKKSETARARRSRVQRRRLVALGVPDEKVKRMDVKDVRLMLKRPVRVKKQYAAKTP